MTCSCLPGWVCRECLEREIEQLKKVYGKTLRDEFAMAALTGLTNDTKFVSTATTGAKLLAAACYEVADAMMSARGNK